MATTTMDERRPMEDKRAMSNKALYWGIAVVAVIVLAIIYGLSAAQRSARNESESGTMTASDTVSNVNGQSVSPDNGNTGVRDQGNSENR